MFKFLKSFSAMKAMGYLGAVMAVLGSVSSYKMHKDESVMAGELATVLVDVLKSSGVRFGPLTPADEQRLHDDIVDIVDVFEGKLY